MNDLTKKLRLVEENSRYCLLNPPAGFFDRLDLPAGTAVPSDLVDGAEVMQVFVQRREEVEALAPRLQAAVGPGTILWVTYPKQTAALESDLNRDRLWALLQPCGLRPVARVAVDGTGSAMRFKKES